MHLNDIQEKYFEAAGVCVGFIGPTAISMQIYAEWVSKAPSTLSPAYLAGFLFIYFFWFIYGVRFRRMAIWIGNIIGVILQVFLLFTVLISKK